MQSHPCVGHQGGAAPFAGVKALHIETEQGRVGKQSVRACGEVLQTRAHGKYHIRLTGQHIGVGRAIHSDRAQVERMVPMQGAFSAVGLHHGDAVLLGKAAQRITRVAVEHAPTGHDQRALGRLKQSHGALQFVRVRRRSAKADHLGLQKIVGAIKRMGLHVLRQCQAHRPAGRRIGHDLDGTGQGAQDLLGPRDPVKVARHRAQRVIGAQVALLKALNLLQHGVGRA